jgi:hypothetical protein
MKLQDVYKLICKEEDTSGAHNAIFDVQMIIRIFRKLKIDIQDLLESF